MVFLGTLNIKCRIIIGTQKGTIILTTTQILGGFHGIFLMTPRFRTELNADVLTINDIQYSGDWAKGVEVFCT